MEYEIFRNTFILVASGLFGLCCGSFFNVCIYRLPRQGITLSRPLYSFCPHCYTTLKWYENIPLISYLFQKGQCRHCFVWISPRYPLVEVLTAGLFTFTAHWVLISPPSRMADLPLFSLSMAGIFFAYLLFVSALIICSFIDIDLRIIPDEIDKPGMVLAPLFCFAFPQILPRGDVLSLDFLPLAALHGIRVEALFSSAFGVIVGAGIVMGVGVIGKALFQKEAMGFGDVKYMGMIGGFLGFKTVILAFLLACFLGAILGIVKKLFTTDPYIPFGPFLSLGALGMLFYRQEVIRFVFHTYPQWLRQVM